MIDERLKGLINQEIDGVLAPRYRTELARTLEVDSEARAYHSDLKRLAGALALMERPEPPSRLKPEIMNRVRATSRRARPLEISGRRIARELVTRFDRRLTIAFALGCAFGIVMLMLFSGVPGTNFPGRDTQVVGTMKSQQATASPVRRQIMAHDLGKSGGKLFVSSQADLLFLTLQVEPGDGLAVQAIFSESDLEVIEFHNEGGEQGQIEIRTGSLAIRASHGTYSVTLKRLTRLPVPVKVRATGREISVEETVSLKYSK